MKTFNDLAIFIQGSRLYGRLDFANSIFFVSLCLDNGKHDQYILNIAFLRLLFFIMCRMRVLVYQSLNSVSSASSGVGYTVYSIHH